MGVWITIAFFGAGVRFWGMRYGGAGLVIVVLAGGGGWKGDILSTKRAMEDLKNLSATGT